MFRRQNDKGNGGMMTMMRLGRGMVVLAVSSSLSFGSAAPGIAWSGLNPIARPAAAAHQVLPEQSLLSTSPGYELPWLIELMQQVSTILDRLIDAVAAHVDFSAPRSEPGSVTVAPSSPAPASLTVEQVEASLVSQTNAARAAAGLPPLQVDATLTTLARQRSQDMIDRDFFSHSDPATGDSLVGAYCIAPLGVAYCGENLAGASGLADAEANVVGRWLASDGHRENILRTEFGRIGIGVTVGGRWGAVVTQLFAP